MTSGERIITFLFVFSIVAVMVNASGLWSGNLPAQNISVSSSRIEEITASQTLESEDNGFISSITGGVKFIVSSMGFLKSQVVGLYDFPQLMAAYGVPSYITTGLFALIILSCAFMLLKWSTGRN